MKMYNAESLVAKLEAAQNELLMRGQIAAERNIAKFALQVVYDEPTVDAEPVRHGRWEHKYYPTVWYGSGEPPEWICSECQERAYNTYDYCPNCGAKMDGGISKNVGYTTGGAEDDV